MGGGPGNREAEEVGVRLPGGAGSPQGGIQMTSFSAGPARFLPNLSLWVGPVGPWCELPAKQV